MFSCKICKIFRNTFFLQNTSDGCFCLDLSLSTFFLNFQKFCNIHYPATKSPNTKINLREYKYKVLELIHSCSLVLYVWLFHASICGKNFPAVIKSSQSLTLPWRRPISYRNHWFLYDIGLRHEKVNWI